MMSKVAFLLANQFEDSKDEGSIRAAKKPIAVRRN